MSFYTLIKKNEKTFYGAKKIKYFYLPPSKKSSHLIVTFSGFHGRENEGIAASYNYVKPISKIDCHRLFILDDYEGIPSYYLGKNKTMDYEVSVASLIMQIAGQNNIAFKNIITCGSSKGGTAAVYFSIKYNFGYACVGAFQLKVGTYLKNVSSYTRESVLKLITGGFTQDSVDYLDNYYINFYENQENTNTQLYIHAGDKDPHYLNHVVQFLDIMRNRDIEYNLNLAEYESHGQIGTFYTEYLLETLPKITNQNIIKSLEINRSDDYINVVVETVSYFTEKNEVTYAFYVYNSKTDKRLDFINYSESNILNYRVKEPGKYRIKAFVKTGENKISQYTDYIEIEK